MGRRVVMVDFFEDDTGAVSPSPVSVPGASDAAPDASDRIKFP